MNNWKKRIKKLVNKELIQMELINDLMDEREKSKEEIERLKELSKVDSQQAQEIIIELKQEIERLKEELKELKGEKND